MYFASPSALHGSECIPVSLWTSTTKKVDGAHRYPKSIPRIALLRVLIKTNCLLACPHRQIAIALWDVGKHFFYCAGYERVRPGAAEMRSMRIDRVAESLALGLLLHVSTPPAGPSRQIPRACPTHQHRQGRRRLRRSSAGHNQQDPHPHLCTHQPTARPTPTPTPTRRQARTLRALPATTRRRPGETQTPQRTSTDRLSPHSPLGLPRRTMHTARPASSAHAQHLVHAEITAVSSALRRAARSRERSGYFSYSYNSHSGAATSYAALLAQTDTSALALTAFATEAAQRSLSVAFSAFTPAPPLDARPVPPGATAAGAEAALPSSTFGTQAHTYGRRLSHLASNGAGLGSTSLSSTSISAPASVSASASTSAPAHAPATASVPGSAPGGGLAPPSAPAKTSSPTPGRGSSYGSSPAITPYPLTPGGGLEAIATDDSETGLLASFVILSAQLRELGSVELLPLPLLVSPFVKTVLSPRTKGAATSTALQALDRMLSYGLIPLCPPGPPDAVDPSYQVALLDVAHAVTHCRFEAGDAVIDELVLLRILSLLRQLVCPSGLDYSPSWILTQEAVCELVETTLSMACQTRLSGKDFIALFWSIFFSFASPRLRLDD